MEPWPHEGIPCPACGQVQDVAIPSFHGKDREPQPGDMTICANCVTVLVFHLESGRLGFRVATDQDLWRCTPEYLGELQMVRYKAWIMRAVGEVAARWS